MAESESKIAGASYIVSFQNDLENVNQTAAAYINFIVGLMSKYSEYSLESGEVSGLEPQEQTALLQTAQTLKAVIFATYIRYEALKDKVPEFQSTTDKKDNLKTYYEKIRTKSIPEIEHVEKYVIALNRVFCAGVMSEILLNSKTVLAGLVS